MNFIEEIIFLQFHLGLNLPLNFFEQKEKNWVLSLNRSYHLKRNQKRTLITWIKITLTSTMGAFPIMPSDSFFYFSLKYLFLRFKCSAPLAPCYNHLPRVNKGHLFIYLFIYLFFCLTTVTQIGRYNST